MNNETKIRLLTECIPRVKEKMKACELCPRKCRVNRFAGEKGYCEAGNQVKVYAAFLHQGEEPVISVAAGSGTVFFSYCGLRCSYCQNYKFSHVGRGEVLSTQKLTAIFMKLQEKGAVNINLVTPSHYLLFIAQSLEQAYAQGLKIPIVYNTSGYENIEIIKSLEGIIDIYLADYKYEQGLTAQRYSAAKEYPQICREVLIEMDRQVQPSVLNEFQIMEKGLIVRHLVLPGHIKESERIIEWVTNTLPNAYISVMAQYMPYFRAKDDILINRHLSYHEYLSIKNYMESLEIEKGWVQEFNPQEELAGVHFEQVII